MSEDRREPRIPVTLQGRYRTGNGTANDVVVQDISTTGCKFYDRFSNLQTGNYLSIRVGNIGPIDAAVRWKEGTIVGVRFDSPMHASVLEHMVKTIPDWQPPANHTEPPRAGVRKPTQPSVQAISINVRPPTISDIRTALVQLQMTLPLRTEAEFEAVFHRVLELILVDQST